MEAEGKPIGEQWWDDLLFLHWKTPAELLQPRLPSGIGIDQFEGEAWLSIVPFRVTHSRPKIVPAAAARLLPGSNYLELNVRTYVRGPDGQPGVWFFSLDASKLAPVLGARTLYRLPYFLAEMDCRREPADGSGSMIDFASERFGADDLVAGCHVRYRPAGPPTRAAKGSLNAFLLERYVLFASKNGRLYRARVDHPPYPMQSVEVTKLRQNILPVMGLGDERTPDLGHYARHLEVDIYPLQRA